LAFTYDKQDVARNIMKLIYQKDHLSITQFNPIDIPDFTILTGINGAGKSHLLQAIENRSVLVDGETTDVTPF
jgi:predicted ATPase